MTIDTYKTLELLHNSHCSFSYNTNPSRYTIEQKELVKFVNFIYGKAIDDFVENVKDTLITNYSVFNTGDIRLFIDAIEDVAEQLKAGEKE